MPTRPSIDEVAFEIRRYVMTHRFASDSLPGVQHWWLSGLGYEVGPEIVQQALDSLVACGAVERSAQGDGTVVYSALAHPHT